MPPLFAPTLVLVPVAASVSTFPALWEPMAPASQTPAFTEHAERRTVRQADRWYAVPTYDCLAMIGRFAEELAGPVTALGAAPSPPRWNRAPKGRCAGSRTTCEPADPPGLGGRNGPVLGAARPQHLHVDAVAARVGHQVGRRVTPVGG
ncbi:hypothetical protein HEP81_00838 [Streptomyces griseofuscus]|uniref:Uncharacterized protein n=1 Tax=Streptomyces griseofuscus TaxID=146922 RepID=A0A7H1PSZ2_9ACTN|nr:hypothetical protein HEP81_00838 [Streptomyces griseofuscus]